MTPKCNKFIYTFINNHTLHIVNSNNCIYSHMILIEKTQDKKINN